MAVAAPGPGAFHRFDNINLLRAVAALLVVVYHVIEHAHWTTFPTQGPLVAFRIGWLGVDLFFVISGFVIAYSALTLHRRSPGDFQRAYWARRLTRILPLYLVTLALFLLAFRPMYAGWSAGEWARQLAAHLTFTHNASPETHGSIDGPNWSLAIEMQFYLAVALAIRWLDRTPGWRIWLVLTLVAWAWRAAVFHANAGAEPYVVFVRVTQLPGTLDAFGAGIFLAKLLLDGKPAARHAAWGWLAAAVVLGTVTMQVYWPRATYWDQAAMVIFWRTLLAAFVLAVLATAVRMPQLLSRWPWRPLDGLGEISYGLYLWHLFAVLAAVHLVGREPLTVLAIVLPATLAAAMLSWHLLEKPFMRLARR